MTSDSVRARVPAAGAGAALGYAPALDGIRALAVLAVLLFHAGVSWLPGGFLGVDVFFVLSGFLISTLLLAEWRRTGKVDLVAFWGRRARRLLPALLLLVLVVVTVGRLLLDPETVHLLRADALAALLYVANWRMLVRGHGGYFAATASPSPLQHTWSLGIEEQFYLIWPLLLLLLMWRGGSPGRVLRFSIAGAAVSAALAGLLFRPGADPSRVYYGTDTRAQALLCGCALAALLATGRVRLNRRGRLLLGALAALAVAGLGWAWAAAQGDASWLYRGGLLLVALATTAVLAQVSLVPRSVCARVLSLPPLPAIGKISYGLYLWHWPVFLALDAERTGLSGAALLLARVAVSVVTATLSCWLVERPIRQRRWSVRLAVPSLATTVVAVGAVALATTGVASPGSVPVAGGAPVRITASPHPSATTQGAAQAHQVAWAAHHRNPGPPRVDFFGDSVAWTVGAYLPPHPGLVTHDLAVQGCGIALGDPYSYIGGLHQTFPECHHWPAIWRRGMGGSNPDVSVILLDRWELVDRVHNGHWEHVGQSDYDQYLLHQLTEAIKLVSADGANVVLLTAPYNERGEKPDGSLYDGDYPSRVDAWNGLLRQVAAHYPGHVSVLDLGKKVCPNGKFTWTDAGIQVRSDGTHFTPAGVQWLAPWLLPRLAAQAR